MYWQTQDRRTLKKLNKLIDDTRRNGYDGIGKPEPLTGNMTGYWSKHIDEANRLVFRLTDDCVEVYECRGHYGEF